MNHFDPDAAAIEGSGIFGLPFTPGDARVVIVPVPFEATTSYGGGTSLGPQAVFEASKQVDLFDRETGRPYEAGIAMLEVPKKIARWNEKAKRSTCFDALKTACGPEDVPPPYEVVASNGTGTMTTFASSTVNGRP